MVSMGSLPGFLTGTNIPPCIAIMTCVLDALLAAAQGVRNYGLELGQTLHLVQDAAAIAACGELVQEYLVKCGYPDVFTSVTSLHWMGAWPHDDAQSAALVVYGGTVAAIGATVTQGLRLVEARERGTVRNLGDRRFDLYRIDWSKPKAGDEGAPKPASAPLGPHHAGGG